MRTGDLLRELGRLSNVIDSQELVITDYKLKAAMYKAHFFHRNKLAETLEKQIKENYDNIVGEFDGFCYASWRARAVYRTLEDMARHDIITELDYRFCKC